MGGTSDVENLSCQPIQKHQDLLKCSDTGDERFEEQLNVVQTVDPSAVCLSKEITVYLLDSDNGTREEDKKNEYGSFISHCSSYNISERVFSSPKCVHVADIDCLITLNSCHFLVGCG